MNLINLSMLAFQSPWWAVAGLVALGLPLVAHLLSRARYREAWFPATRLVQQAVVSTTRVERPRHLLLLLLRVLLLLLIVAAFTRPRWLPDADAAAGDKGVALIVLLDRSASMQRISGGATLYDRALRETKTLLGGLDPARDVASVLLVGREPAALLPEPTAQFKMLQGRLSDAQAGYERADWPRAIAQARRQAALTDRKPRLVVISDQQGGWPGADMDNAERPRLATEHLRIDGPTDNVAVRLVDLRPYPPIAGRNVTATVEVSNYGGSPVTLPVVAALGQARLSIPVRVRSGAQRRIEMTLPVAADAIRDADRGLLRIGIEHDDAIGFDNAAGAYFEVQQRPRVLVAHGEQRSSATLARRIATLLDPGEVEGQLTPEVRVVSESGALSALERAEPAGLRTIVLVTADAQGAESALGRAVARHTRAGGGVLVLPAPSDAAATTDKQAAAGIDFGLDPLRVFQGPARAGLAALRWPLLGNLTSDDLPPIAELILKSSNSEPIVSVLTEGRGRRVTLHASPAPVTGGLLAEPSFVVLFNELCRYASPGPALPEPAKPGDLLPAEIRQAPNPPDTDRIDEPGRVYLGSADNGQAIAGVWAELDPDESDTQPATPWTSTDGADNPGLGNSAPSASALAQSIRPTHIELWPYLVAGALLLAATESGLLWRFAGGKRGVA